ncbi:hypothetical protein J6590_056563 [Homalodisca vitripennis]|nr:hypothetical protein J6590_056563 [Homalodisca vitripennis]
MQCDTLCNVTHRNIQFTFLLVQRLETDPVTDLTAGIWSHNTTQATKLSSVASRWREVTCHKCLALTVSHPHKCLNAERAVFKRANSTGGRGPGRPPNTDIPLEELFAADDEVRSRQSLRFVSFEAYGHLINY